MVTSMQPKQNEWLEQWTLLNCNELFLFQEWIAPFTLNDFQNKDILECGCGGGQHTNFMAKYANSITAVDLNTIDLAKKRNALYTNIKFIEADIAQMDLKKQFDIVVCIGVLQHTDNPDHTIKNLKKHLKPGGLLLLWCYSMEGNFLVKNIVEPIRKKFLAKISRKQLVVISKVITSMLYLPIYSLYLLPITVLPYYQYFQNFRKMSFYRNMLNVFDKLNAPQTIFFSKNQILEFVSNFQNINLCHYRKVSWRVSGYKSDA